METIQSKEQLQGIVQALYYANQLSNEPIEDEKELYLSVKEIAPYRYCVKIDFLDYFITPDFENDENEKHINHQILYYNIGNSVHKIVKDILVELETVYNAPLPDVRTKDELKELVNNEN